MKSLTFLPLAVLALLAGTGANAQVYGEAYILSFPEGNSADVYGSATAYCDNGEMCLTPGVVATIYNPSNWPCATGMAWGVSGQISSAEVDLECTVTTSGYASIEADLYSHDEPDGPDDMGYMVGEDWEETAVDLDATPWITGIDPSTWAPDNTGGQSFAISGGGFGTSPSISITGDVGSWSITDHTDTSISAWVDLSNSSGGTATVTVTSNGYGGMSFLPGPDNDSPTSQSASAQIQVPIPTISGTHTLWWFGGSYYSPGLGMVQLNPPGYDTSITLTSSAGSATAWRIAQGADKVVLSTATGTHTTVTSTGTAFSGDLGDIQIVATIGGVDSSPFLITSRTPSNLVRVDYQVESDSTFGYVTHVTYAIVDNLDTQLPSTVPVNESWTTGLFEDMTGANWDNGVYQGLPQQGALWAQNAAFVDEIQGQLLVQGVYPLAFYGPSNSTAVDHWGQRWSVGTQSTGRGVPVQDDTLQKYQGRADHL